MSFVPKPAGYVTSVEKLDGIFIISSSWSVWNPLGCPVITFPLTITKQRTNTFIRGNRTLSEKEYIYAVKLFDVGNHSLELCFCTNEDFYLYSTLLQLTNSSLEKALRRVGSSETSERMDHKVKNFINTTRKSHLLISLSDYHELGDFFAAELSSALSITDDEDQLRFCFISHSAAHSCPIEYFANHFWDINVRYVKEVLYHLAYDFEEDGKYLLWNRWALLHILGSPSHEYYPNLVGNFGNYYFSNRDPTSDDLCVMDKKFYSSSHKFVHDKLNRPFTKPRFSTFLLKAVDDSSTRKKRTMEKDCEELKLQLQLLTRIPEVYARKKTGSARLEIILTCFKVPRISEANGVCKEYIVDRDLLNHDALYAFPPEILGARCSDLFEPFVKFVAMLIESYESTASDQETDFDFLNLRPIDVLACLAGESLVAMMLYGTSVSTRFNEGFPYDLCKDVGAIVKKISAPDAETFPDIGNGRLFVNEKNFLVYEPRFEYSNFFTRTDSFQQFDIAQVYQLVVRFENDLNKIGLAEAIKLAIFRAINLAFDRKNHDWEPLTFRSTHFLRETYPECYAFSPAEFAANFFRLPSKNFALLRSVSFLRNLILSRLTTTEISALEDFLGRNLLEEANRLRTAFFFPANSEILFAITPDLVP